MAKKPSKTPPQVERIDPQQPRHQIIAQHMEGPLPPPAMLAEYDRVHPGLAGIIIDSFQNESKHRHALESIAMETDAALAVSFTRERKRGQIFGFIIAIGLIAGSVTLGYLDKQWAAVALGGAGFASIVGAFVIGRQGGSAKQGQEK